MHRLFKEAADRTESFTAEFSNLSPSQAEQFKRLFAWMNFLGGVGASRELTVFYDGDGAARCEIKVDGKRLKPDVTEREEHDPSNYENLRFGFD